MPKIDYFVPVDADLQTIWTVLLDRIENPSRYMGGVDSCTFLENTEEYAIREVVFQGVPLRERITIDEHQGEVRYELIDHPLFTGDVINALIPPAPNDPKATPIIQFRMNWQPLSPDAQALEADALPTLQDSLHQAVHYTRDLAEHLQKQPTHS